MANKSRTRSSLRVKPLTDSQKTEMISMRLNGVSAGTVARRFRITVRSLAAYVANFTRGNHVGF